MNKTETKVPGAGLQVPEAHAPGAGFTKTAAAVLAALLAVLLSLFLLTRLLVPKYTGRVTEGSFTEEYYKDPGPHDVLFLGDCEVYENISPVTLWNEYGITSYIRGNAQQLIPQSYYLLEESFRYETPKAVVLSVAAMQEIGQVNEAYNRMTLDGMRWSKEKLEAVLNTKMEDEHLVEYIFPLLRFHSRWSSLEEDDLRYLFRKPLTTHSGYYLRADVRPAGEFPESRRPRNPRFEEKGMDYLERIRKSCETHGVTLVLFKAPSLYPAWHGEWNQQIEEYAASHGLLYINALADIEKTGIDFSTDSYDGGLHMNVYGAEKMARYLGPILKEAAKLPDRREDSGPQESADAGIIKQWEMKTLRYEEAKAAQEKEFAEKGYLTQFTE